MPDTNTTGQNVVPAGALPPNQPVIPANAVTTQPVAQQPVLQPVAVVQAPPQPAPAQTAAAQQLDEQAPRAADGTHEIKLISHSSLFYWWPVWVVGFVLAAISYAAGTEYRVKDGVTMTVHPNQGLGIVFGFTLLLVMLITNVVVRGLASALVIVSAIAVTLLFAYLGWWGDILGFVGNQHLYVSADFYLAFSVVAFLIWAVTVFAVDRMSFWRIRPGQITQEFVFGASAKSYDTNNLVMEKYRDDLFRHWVLGLGSGDLRLKPHGSDREEIFVPNVLFIGSKINTIQQMVATDPDNFGGGITVK